MKSLLPLTLILMSTSALAVDPIDQYQGGQIVILKAQVKGLQSQIDTLVATAGEAEKTFHFVGFSASSMSADGGIFALNSACQSSFAGSKMCTSEEISNTVNPTMFDVNTKGWVQPTFSASGNTNVDYSGEVPSNCGGWDGEGGSISTAVGLVVNGVGVFTRENCDNLISVACCSDQ